MRHPCRGVLVLLVLVLVMAGGCRAPGEDRPTTRTAPSGALLIEPVAARDLGYVANWVSDLQVRRGDQVSYARVLGDFVVTVQQQGNVVSAVSIRDGSVAWRRSVGRANEALFRPAVAGDTLLINSDRRLYTLRLRTGQPLGVYDLDRLVGTGPAVVDDLAIFGGIDGTVFAHGIDSGFARWRFALTSRIATAPTVIGNYVFASDTNGRWAMLSPMNGEVNLRGRTFAAITTPPASDRSTLFIPSHDGNFYAINRATGADQWVHRGTTPLSLRPAVFDQLVILPVPDRGLIAFETVSGEQRWTSDQVRRPITSRGDNIVMTTSRDLLLVNPEEGSIIADAPTQPLVDVLTGPDDSLILVGPTGRMIRLNPTR
jgi:outer membrane protein assembly factor BamB